jgi:hypothetical protein
MTRSARISFNLFSVEICTVKICPKIQYKAFQPHFATQGTISVHVSRFSLSLVMH